MITVKKAIKWYLVFCLIVVGIPMGLVFLAMFLKG